MMPNLSTECQTPTCSSNCKSVFLREWWLIKVGSETKLGVGGYANRETLGSRGMRLLRSASAAGNKYNINSLENGIQHFCSAPISKRLDNNTLQAVDGIIITISGCINKCRTLSYGFSPEVCGHFLFGFPCTWEDYASASASKVSHEKCGRVSLDNLPVTRVRDLLMSTTGESESRALTSIIIKDILKQCNQEESLNQSASSLDSDEKASVNSTDDHNEQDGVSSTHKITENTRSFPVGLNEKDTKKSKETEDDDDDDGGGFISNATHKITKEAKVNIATMSGVKRILTRSQKEYQLRSTRIRNDSEKLV